MLNIFAWCTSLTSIDIPKSLTSIELAAFANTGLTSIIIPGNVKSIGGSAFAGCSALTSVLISEGVKNIGGQAFGSCNDLKSITIPGSVTDIGQGAFKNCKGLVSVDISDGVISIGDEAFRNCSSLTSVIIPNSVANIGDLVFDGTPWLQNQSHGLVYAGKVAYLWKGTMPDETDVILKEDTKGIAGRAFSGCKGLISITIPDSVTNIGPWAFSYCSKLTSISIPEGVTIIGDGAFQNCSSLTSVIIPNSVVNIGDLVFDGTPWLQNQSNGLVYAGKVAYLWKGTMPDETDIILKEDTKGIARGAFSGCKGLISITIPNSVTNIGSSAFSGCTAMAELISHATTPPTCSFNALGDINKQTCKLTVPYGCIGAYQAVNQWKDFFFIEEGEKPKIQIAINEDNFPDENFRAFLKEQWYGQDDILTEEEIYSITMIAVSNNNIKNLKGIEFFTALDSLYCASNQLTSLDVSKNSVLTHLGCNNNQLTSLDVSNNTALTLLSCFYNQLTSLDVSKNTALMELDCGYNQLESLDVSGCTTLKKLYCFSNQLTSLDVSKNTALTHLWCYNNQLTSLDVSKNIALTHLSCFNNPLATLDVSNNSALTSLWCYNNKLTNLDVSKNTALTYLSCGNNQLTSLDVSKNIVLQNLYCYDNKIKGEAMDALVGSLPIRSSAEISVIDLSNSFEENVCTTIQVNIAKEKGWSVMAYTGQWLVDYNGSDPSGILGITLDKNANVPIYDLNGRRLKEPRKGINIIDGKKVVVK